MGFARVLHGRHKDAEGSVLVEQAFSRQRSAVSGQAPSWVRPGPILRASPFMGAVLLKTGAVLSKKPFFLTQLWYLTNLGH